MNTTDSQSELLTEVDNRNQVIGPITRSLAHHGGGKFYRTIYILAKDHTGKILIQKRSASKDLYPNCMDLSVGGHVNFGESYLEAAVRELKEELGIIAPPSNLKFIKEVLVTLPTSNEFFKVFEYSLKPTDHLNLSTEEISSISWMTDTEIRQSIQSDPQNWYPRPIQVFASIYPIC